MIYLNRLLTKEETFKFLKDNKKYFIRQKKFEMKKADDIYTVIHSINEKGEAIKSENHTQSLLESDKMRAKLIINTTKLFDSHKDVHIDGLWKKTLKEQKGIIYFIQEHKMDLKHVISDNLKIYTENLSWKDLGFNFEGQTQALVFDAVIEKARNEYMFEQYAKGYVVSHSVGMQYVKLFMCINSEEKYYREEKENWDKYIDHVANREDAEEYGYFWAVTEAKLIEGSAVLKGSNWATPTQSLEVITPQSPLKGADEPPLGTQGKDIEPSEDTQKSLFEKFS